MKGPRGSLSIPGGPHQAHGEANEAGRGQNAPSSQATKKRLERLKSEGIKETLKKIIDSMEVPDGIRGVTASGLEERARRQRKTVDIDLLLADTIDVIKYTLATSRVDPVCPGPSSCPEDASVDDPKAQRHHAFLREAWMTSNVAMSMVVRTSDLVVLESSNAVHAFEPWKQYRGYVGQSLWYHTDWKDHDALEELQSNMSAGTSLGVAKRVRFRRVMPDQNTPNLLYSYRSQTVKVVHVWDDCSCALMIFENSFNGYLPLATDQDFWNKFDNVKISVLRPNSYVALKEVDKMPDAAKLPKDADNFRNVHRLLDINGIFNKFHAWLAALVIHSWKLVFCHHRDVSGPEKGLARLSCFCCDGADARGINNLEPFWEFNFRHDNALYLTKSRLEPFYIRHAIRMLEDGTDDDDLLEEYVQGDINLVVLEGVSSKPIVCGFGETVRRPERHLCRILTPAMLGERPSLFQMEYLADPNCKPASPSDTIRVREMATLMGTICQLTQYLYTSHGNFEGMFQTV